MRLRVSRCCSGRPLWRPDPPEADRTSWRACLTPASPSFGRHGGRPLRTSRRGIVFTEIVVGLVLMLLLASLMVDAVVTYGHTRDAYFWRQAAAWAADAQLQRYRAGAPSNSSPPQGLIPEEITLKTSSHPAHGSWEGFNRVTVTATATLSTGRLVHEQISGYFPMEGKR